MKQLSGFSILNVNGMDRATFTYDEIDEKSFYIVDAELKTHVDAIRKFITVNKVDEA